MNLSSGRVLVVKTTSMGDVVHTLPAITDLHRARPGLTIDWLVEQPFAAIPALHPAVRRVIPIAWRRWRKRLFERDTQRAIADARAALRREPYDLVVDFQGLLKSALWAVQARGPRVGYDRASAREPLAALAYARGLAVPKDLHAVERSRRLMAAAFALPAPGGAPDFGLAAPAVGADDWRMPARAAVLIPCASRPEKLWPEDRWIAVAHHLRGQGLTPVVWWGNDVEQARAQRIAAACDGVVPPFLTVGASAGALARAARIVGLDTGFSHLGAAFGVPTLGIYCDHEPGLAGIVGGAEVASIGGKGQVPSLDDVLARLPPPTPRAAPRPPSPSTSSSRGVPPASASGRRRR